MTMQNNPAAITDLETTKKAIKTDRVRFGLGTILYQSEEMGLGPVPTVIIRSLGGDDRHLGMLSSLGAFGGLARLLANPLLKWKKSNQKAMIFTMKVGFLLAGLIALFLLTGNNPAIRTHVLLLYMGLSILFGAVSYLQGTVEMNWIGDLVPLALRGWFTKVKWGLSVCGIIIFTLLISRYAQFFPTLNGYASIYVLFAISFLAAAAVIYPRTTDRVPKVANYVSQGPTGHERINYKIPVLWLNFTFGILWGPARAITGAFIPVYLMDQFGLSLTKIALILTIQSVMSIVVITLIGDKTDKWGARKPLIVLTLLVAFSMSLWFFSAWWGIGCAIAYMAVNGMSGHTMSMLGGNFNLEIYPAKGRAAYIGFYTLVGLPFILCSTFFSGYLAHNLGDIQYQFHGATLNRYHIVFLCTTILALLSTIPLILTGSKRVQAASRQPE